jgi:hypothetical protein
MKVSIGKNTLGGGKKMMARLNNYNRSTHDNSFVMRTTMAPGVLVPTMAELLLPGDTYPIQTRCHTLTHPTVGPLFGSFKQQNDFFFCPIRLYNAMLHNNALNIGLDMKKVKFPYMRTGDKTRETDAYLPGSNETLLNQVNPSSLLGYLGWGSLQSSTNNGGWEEEKWNFIKPIMYFDIFKNYYANKQEPKFYTIGVSGIMGYNNTKTDNGFYFVSCKYNGSNWVELNRSQKPNFNYIITEDGTYGIAVVFKTSIEINQDAFILQIENPNFNGKRYANINNSITELKNNRILSNITLTGNENITPITTAFLIEQSYAKISGTNYRAWCTNANAEYSAANYNQYDLTEIDDMRENILAAGKIAYSCTEKFLNDIVKPIASQTTVGKTRPACSVPMVGLALKTYQSDINTNWVNTEWIDGDTGINAITAIDTSGGSFTLDTLNLAKKVYTMLNRIAVSDGSYNAWIQTVYTSGGLNHIETPLYLGGSSLEIEFQEVVNNSGTEDQPLGTLAGRGIATSHKGGNIVFKADEPGYIFCISSITPRVDYYQGTEWDLYLETIDDLHKPQLDGIGFQDRLYKHLNASCRNSDLEKSIGKQPAWIQYMTNFNRTKGNFALIENEGWMCLNRIFGNIDTYTTYVFPHLYNNIFADTDITAQNFWVQIAFNYKPRRVMSAKVIPNI